MLTDVALQDWFQRLGISGEAQTVIRQVRVSDPARRVGVGGNRGNVSGFYPSKKMGVTIQFESHRVELAEVYVMEYDARHTRRALRWLEKGLTG